MGDPCSRRAGTSTISIPYLTTVPSVPWVSEAGAIPVIQPVVAAETIGPGKKLAVIVGLTTEIADYSADNAELVIRQILAEAAAKSLDSNLFSNAASSSSRPAGLLNGVTGLTPSGSTGATAMAEDVGALMQAVADAGGNPSRVMIVAAAKQATVLQMLSSPNFSNPIVPSNALAAGTVIAIDVDGFASAFGADPQIDVGREATLQMEDTSPAATLSSAGSPNTVVAPVRSFFQTYSYSLRLIVRAAWGARAPGLVQFMTSVAW